MWEARIYCLSDEFRMAMKDLLSAVQVDRPPQMQLCLQSQMVAFLGKVLKMVPRSEILVVFHCTRDLCHEYGDWLAFENTFK